jgi:hypothetical protein
LLDNFKETASQMQADERTLPEIIDEAAALFAKFVVPLYESDTRLRPSLHGTGFFVRTGERHFLVSAGHVLETLKTRPLFYYVSPGITRKLSGQLLLNPWQGDRENDPIDVGVLRLSDEELPPYPEVNKFAMDISYLRPGLLPRSGRNYMIVGFPASQSEVSPMAREVAATAYGYRNYSIEDSAYFEQGLTPEANLVLPLHLEVGFDSSGKHRNFPRPQGMSGSPVWALYDEDGRDDLRMFPVVAVGTKYRKKEGLLVGTDIAVVLNMIHDAV